MGADRRKYGTNQLACLDLRRSPLKEQLRDPARPIPVGLTVDGVAVSLVFTPCRFGGRRPWMLCGRCGGRCVTLYRDPRTHSWRCRRCLGLVYPSQRASRDLLGTAQLRLEALCRRFDPEWEYGNDYPKRPAGVHRRTWARFRDAIRVLESRLEKDFIRKVGRFVYMAERVRQRKQRKKERGRVQRRVRRE